MEGRERERARKTGKKVMDGYGGDRRQLLIASTSTIMPVVVLCTRCTVNSTALTIQSPVRSIILYICVNYGVLFTAMYPPHIQRHKKFWLTTSLLIGNSPPKVQTVGLDLVGRSSFGGITVPYRHPEFHRDVI